MDGSHQKGLFKGAHKDELVKGD